MTDLKAGLYRHYKGGFYQLIGMGAHSETDQLMVVYVALSADLPGPRLRIRPAYGIDGWFSKTDDGQERFTYVGTERTFD